MRPSLRLILTYVLLLFASLPFTPYVVDWLKARNMLLPSVALIFAGAAVTGAYLLVVRLRIRSLRFYALLALLLALLAGIVLTVKTNQEQVHFLEYGLLAVLVGIDARRPTVAFLAAAAIGLFDECLQYFLPMRYFDLRDIAFNVTAAAFGAVAWALIRRFAPEFHSR